jgi:hypothetical protein
MKDPIVAEVRRHRLEHTKRFNSDLRSICEDLRRFEATLGDRVVKSRPNRLTEKGKSKSQPPHRDDG